MNLVIFNKNIEYRNTLSSMIIDRYKSVSIILSTNNIKQLEEKVFNTNIVDFLLIRFDRTFRNPIEFISNFKKRNPNTKIIAMSFSNEIDYKNKLMRAGVYFYYEVGSDFEILIKTLKK